MQDLPLAERIRQLALSGLVVVAWLAIFLMVFAALLLGYLGLAALGLLVSAGVVVVMNRVRGRK